jgi:alpha-1,2-mannosyltransferase
MRKRLQLYGDFAKWLALVLWWGAALVAALRVLGTRLGLPWHKIACQSPYCDFSAFWQVARMASAGQAALAYDPTEFLRQRVALLGQGGGDLFWFYPPTALLAVVGVSALTLYAAFWIWTSAVSSIAFVLLRAADIGFLVIIMGLLSPAALWALELGQFGGLTGALLASGLRRLGAGGPFVLATFAYLPITENAAVGESAFLATGLLAWALAWLTRRPALAGCILAGLAVKPQFLLPIGLFLLFGRRWRALGGLAGGVVLLVGLAAWLFGLPAWWLYATITVPHAAWVFAHGGVSYALQITPASAMLQLGALRVPVLAVQAAFSLFAVAALWRARRAPLAVQGAMLAATFPLLLTTMLVYDATICGIAILLLWQEALRTGFLPYEKTVLALLFVAPLITFILRPVNVPLDPLIPALFLLSLRRRCATDPATTKRLPYTPPETKPAR